MTIQVLDKFGHAVQRKWFSCVETASAWLDAQFPHRDRLGYTVEIFYD